jgi:hypothetical protein
VIHVTLLAAMNTGTSDKKVIGAIFDYFRTEISKNIHRGNTSLSGSKFMCKEVESYQSVVTKNESKYIFIIRS